VQQRVECDVPSAIDRIPPEQSILRRVFLKWRAPGRNITSEVRPSTLLRPRRAFEPRNVAG
jgi:hypothetical protein